MNLVTISTILLILPYYSSSKYLTAGFDFDYEKNLINDTTLIEFWPNYLPLESWIILDNNNSLIDFTIGFIKFNISRLIDYEAYARGIIPVINLWDFDNRDLSFKNIVTFVEVENNTSCDYDTVWYNIFSKRYYAYHGFKKIGYDEYYDTLSTGYGNIPFTRNIDTVFRNPINNYTTFISNDWYYSFDDYDRFINQGRISYLWSDLSIPFIDSVLVTRNRSVCKFFNDKVQCDNKIPIPIDEMFVPIVPSSVIKASFYCDENIYVLLDSENVFWIYNETFHFIFVESFCNFKKFYQFPCCYNETDELAI